MSIVPRKPKKLLSGEQKYDSWLRMLTGQVTTAQAALESGVDRTTIMTVRRVARDAAVEAHPDSRSPESKDSIWVGHRGLMMSFALMR